MNLNDLFARLYELLSFFDGFSDDMYSNNLYLPIGLCMILIPIVCLAVYYYVVNAVKYSKWWHWLIFVLILCGINFGIAYGISFQNIHDMYIDLNTEPDYGLATCCFSFSMINVFWCFLVSFVWSMIIKWGSTNCRRTPF